MSAFNVGDYVRTPMLRYARLKRRRADERYKWDAMYLNLPAHMAETILDERFLTKAEPFLVYEKSAV